MNSTTMNRTTLRTTVLCSAVTLGALAFASTGFADVVVRNATVQTMASGGKMEGVDILVKGDRIAAIGKGLDVPANTPSIDGAGKLVTPGLFGGLTLLGLTEIGIEPNSEDYAAHLGMRPEFDVEYAFNPASTSMAVTRLGGITWAAIIPTTSSDPGGTIIAGQGGAITLDGNVIPNNHALYVEMGGDANELSGGSRAAQFMLLKQALMEARTPNAVMAQDQRLLTPAGRQVLLDWVNQKRLFVIDVDRASDILEVIRFAQAEKLNVAIVGATEAWVVARVLAAAKVPVLLDPLDNLPNSFDQVGATLENAARLNAAGVKVTFSFGDPSPHNIRKLRMAAGVAVAHGLPWDAGLAALTRVPAEIFGVADHMGTLEVGRRADFVVWDGDPLDVLGTAEHVFIGGVPQSMRSRQSDLRDRYFEHIKQGQAR